uniref:JmjC domain-containing protein n=1 Tax=Tanacetum cinerariifolium TaxID=118510 RepID=A0A6L2N162_TANCI|nr:JmjC domain-containing protein [Tanacetum cinerariifolium]
MIRNIGSKRHKFLMYPSFLQMILGIQTTDPSSRPTFDFTAKLFSNMKLNWDGPYMPLLAPMLVVPAGGDGADAAAAGAATANEVSLPPPPPDTSFSPPYPRSEEVGLTTSTRPPSPTRHTSFQEDISEGGGDYVSLPKSNEASPTTSTIAAGGAEDSAALTDLSLKLDWCINRVTTLENELGVTKKVLGGVVLKLVSRVKRLEGLLQQRKRRLVLSDSEGEEATTKEQDMHLDALHKLASTSLGGDTTVRLLTPYTKLPTMLMPPQMLVMIKMSSMDPAGQAAAATSSTIPATDKGKAPMVDDSLPGDLLSEQERILKNLCDYQLGEDLAKKFHADWLELMAKIATNSALSKQLLGDDVNDENMNERLGMLLKRKRRELAEQSRVKPMNKTQQRDFMRDFIQNQSALVYNQGWTMKQVKVLSIAQLKHEFEYIQRTLERSNLLNFKRTSFRPMPTLEAPSAKRARQGVPQDVHAASSQVLASVSAAPSIAAVVSVPTVLSIPPDVSVFAASSVYANTEVDADESRLDGNQTASEHISTEHTVDESTPSSSRTRRKQIAKKRVTPIVDVADDALIKFDSVSDSDDDPLPYAPYSLTDEDAHAFWCNQDNWRIRSWRLYPRAQVHVLETVDGRVIYMFVDISYPLSEATLKRMLQHGLEVPKLLVGGDLTMVTQNWMVITFHVPFWIDKWLVQRGTTLELASPEQTATDQMLLFHDPAFFGVPVGCSCWLEDISRSGPYTFILKLSRLFCLMGGSRHIWSHRLTSKDGQLGLKPKVLSLIRGRLGKIVHTYLTENDFGDTNLVKAPFFWEDWVVPSFILSRHDRKRFELEVIDQDLDEGLLGVLPGRKNSTRKRVVTSSQVEMDPADGARSKRYHIVPYGELNGIPIALVARFGVVS